MPATCRRGPRGSADRFLRTTEEARRERLCSCDEEEACGTLRTMCEASRGRQLRLIRAETDSGRSDGLLNTLTCRQPSARLHFLHPSPFASFTTWPNFACTSRSSRNYCHPYIQTLSINLAHFVPNNGWFPIPKFAVQKNTFPDSDLNRQFRKKYD